MPLTRSCLATLMDGSTTVVDSGLKAARISENTQDLLINAMSKMYAGDAKMQAELDRIARTPTRRPSS
jgi:hypothetical protein